VATSALCRGGWTRHGFHAYLRLGDLRRPDRFGVWVLRIARRGAICLARRKAHEAGTVPLTERDGSTTRLPTDVEELLTAVARLPEHERLVVVLHYLDGRPVAEVAAALGRPVGTVTKQLSRAIERLRIRTRGVLE
jgi:RNA polymerase sigma-70 factor, ECF subfamily